MQIDAPNKEQFIARIERDFPKALSSMKCTDSCIDECVNTAKKEEVCSTSEKWNHPSPLHKNATRLNQLHSSGIQPHCHEYTVKVKCLSGKVILRGLFSRCG